MKSQIPDALCVGRPLPLIPGDVSYLDVLTVIVKLWTSTDLKLQSPQSVLGIALFFLPCLPDLWVWLSTSRQDGHSAYNY